MTAVNALVLIARGVVRRYMGHHVSLLAAAIAYYVLFSVVPVAILATAVAGVVLRDDDLRDELVDQIVEMVPLSEDEGRNSIIDAIDAVKRSSPSLSAVGLFGTVYGSLGMFGAVQRGLDVVRGVERRRPYLRQRLTDAAMLVALGSLLLASVILTGFIGGLQVSSSGLLGPFSRGTNFVWLVAPQLLPAAMSLAAFTAMYRFVPADHPPLRDVWPGALLATIGFEALKYGFGLYVANFGAYDPVYGTLGGTLLFLFFVYLAANVLLIGAEVSGEYVAIRDEGGLKAAAVALQEP